MFGSLHHIDFLAQQVFVQILRYHQIFPTRIIAGIPAGLTDIVGIIGQGQIPDQGALSRALAPQNQHTPGIVIPAHRGNVIPVSQRPGADVRGAHRHLAPVKVNHLALRSVQSLEPACSQIICPAKHSVNRLSYDCLYIPGSLFPVPRCIIFLLGKGLVLHHPYHYIGKMSGTI